jgi:hypothetical protein
MLHVSPSNPLGVNVFRIEYKTWVSVINLLEWVEEMIEKKEFASVSHAVQKALVKLREEYGKEGSSIYIWK